jgi:hypothetical protein
VPRDSEFSIDIDMPAGGGGRQVRCWHLCLHGFFDDISAIAAV